MNIDLFIFNFINGFAGKWQWLDFIGIFFAVHVVYILLAILAIFLLVDARKYRKMALEGVSAALLARFIVVQIIWMAHFRARPFVNNPIHLLLPHFSFAAASFPSAHASFCFALSTIIFFYHKKAGIWFFAASFLVAISRVYVGVHWPSDILAGAVLGILVGWALNKIFKRVAFN